VSARVGLIVTGKCEHRGLAASLQRIFPEARFEALGRQPVVSFTSADVRQLPESPVPTTLQKLAARIVAEVEPGRVEGPLDFVDPDYLQHPDVPHQQSPERKSWAIPGRARHPKHYLRFLCDPNDPYTQRYKEAKTGAEALSQLAWGQVFSHEERVQLARALFEDLSLGLGVPHPFPGSAHPATADFKSARVLRNL